MVNKNFWAALTAHLVEMGTGLVQYNGTTVTVVAGYAQYAAKMLNTTYMKKVNTARSTDSVAGVYFGNGNTPPTADDYWLAGDIVSTFTYNVTATTSIADGIATNTALYTITNTGTEPIVISEIIFAAPAKNNTSAQICYERTALDAPVTIEPGGVGQITYTIRLNYPTV